MKNGWVSLGSNRTSCSTLVCTFQGSAFLDELDFLGRKGECSGKGVMGEDAIVGAGEGDSFLLGGGVDEEGAAIDEAGEDSVGSCRAGLDACDLIEVFQDGADGGRGRLSGEIVRKAFAEVVSGERGSVVSSVGS